MLLKHQDLTHFKVGFHTPTLYLVTPTCPRPPTTPWRAQTTPPFSHNSGIITKLWKTQFEQYHQIRYSSLIFDRYERSSNLVRPVM